MATFLHDDATHAFEVDAPVARVFPLFGPVDERRWAPGWDPEMLHAPRADGTAVGTVFRTQSADAGGAVIWTLVDHDATAGRARYARVAPATHAGTVDVQCEAVGDARTRVTVRYALTALGEAGDAYVRRFFAGDAYARFIDGWQPLVANALRA